MKHTPLLRILYARIAKTALSSYGEHLQKLIGLYTDVHSLEGKSIASFPVYVEEKDLPDEIRSRIRVPRYPSELSHPLPPVTTDEVYVVIQSTDSVGDSGGHDYIMAITENITLAEKLAIGNGPSGSDATVIKVSLNKQLKRSYELILPIFSSKEFQTQTMELYVKTKKD